MALERFSAPVRAWFETSFPAPTGAQEQAWPAIAGGDHTLLLAPTGSGKTLAAFLWAIDRLGANPRPEGVGTRVLYISPLRALAVDIEKNLRAPLAGIRLAAERLGETFAEPSVGIRTGDTAADERRKLIRRPPDILITTPESLYLMLTSQARSTLAGVETVIVDEIHALAATKRGAHLAITLERLGVVANEAVQRIGLSATQRPLDEIARFLGGYAPGSDGALAPRPVTVVDAGVSKEMDLRVVVPVEDMADLGRVVEEPVPGAVAMGPARRSIWPSMHPELLELIQQHRSTIVFVNARRLAERLATRLNELAFEGENRAAEAQGKPPVLDELGLPPGGVHELVKAHHGSLSRERRTLVEDELKQGRLRGLVATSSLELGIDMGAVDLVIQVESPGAVSTGLQRIGRAGHQVGVPSRGRIFPKHRADLLEATVVASRMQQGLIESTRYPRNPLDVLAQHVVAMCAMDDWKVADLARLVRQAANFADLSDDVLTSVLDLLAGRYPSEEFAELRPRIVWDRSNDVLQGRPGAQRLAVSSGGTIPDRGLFGVFLPDGARVGELDEEMVYESRVGETFLLGASTWRIEEITHERVVVTPAPGQPGKMPFWHGDGPGRPVELGRAVGEFTRTIRGPGAVERLTADYALDERAASNLVAYLDEQAEATGVVPDDRTIVVERFRDEIGDWRVVMLSPFGAQVHAPWGMALQARLSERWGQPIELMWSDDGIVLRLPEAIDELPLEDLLVDPDEIDELVISNLPATSMFASRFRECAARALLLPRRRPDRRTPLWQQRQKAADLLTVAAHHPTFPILLETTRECVNDVFDLPALRGVLADIRSRKVRVVPVDTEQASPFAQSLLFGWIAVYMYEGDAPLAERRAAALALDRDLLRDLLGAEELRELIDPGVLADLELELQRLTPRRRARNAHEVHDLLRTLGPLSLMDLDARTETEAPTAGSEVAGSDAEVAGSDAEVAGSDAEGVGDSGSDAGGAAIGWAEADDAELDRVEVGEAVAQRAAVQRSGTGPGPVLVSWVDELVAQRRAIRVSVAGEERLAAAEDAARLRDALGVAIPVGLPTAFTDPVEHPLRDLVERYARTHTPFAAHHAATRLGVALDAVRVVLGDLERAGRVVLGEFRPGGVEREWADPEVLRQLRRRSLAALRREVEPVDGAALARFLPRWQGVGVGRRGPDGLAEVVSILQGAAIPASVLERDVLPARMAEYRHSDLDALCTSGEVVWVGAGPLGARDGRLRLVFRDQVDLLVPLPDDAPDQPTHQVLRSHLADRGASFWPDLVAAVGRAELPYQDADVLAALWDLVWSGEVTNDSLSPLRSVLKPSGRKGGGSPRAGGGRPRPGRLARVGPPSGAGRWSLVADLRVGAAPTEVLHARAVQLVERYGVLTREAALAEGLEGGFAGIYPVLKVLEERGSVRRGYFVEGLGAAQFAQPGAVDRLRSQREVPARDFDEAPDTLVLAATDPAQPYGASLTWPSTAGRPARAAGAYVVLVDGVPAAYLERGGHSLTTFPTWEQTVGAWAPALADLERRGALRAVEIDKVDGGPAAGSPAGTDLVDAGWTVGYRGLRPPRPPTPHGRA